ncbi:DUF1707 SHOCT-like domain-containing protein [Corynebacterium alimapuense]|uniref:Uncharacterized protein n=1 Tax=Corynebacterium alimapuense TaxID=1576874 RepID=A0A3M8K8L4_9CORY|nr:LiaF domain-containing protein [Corynebacterium alimapuense]RNE49561.1 hypothetical protein C5L39_04215 [Corynebacterium alimapuense]
MKELEHQDHREQAQQALTLAVAEGRLDLGEFSELVGIVWSTEEPTVLDSIIAQVQPQQQNSANADLVSPDQALAVDIPQETTSVFGDIERSGYWLVPQQSTITTVFGDVFLDLRRAVAATPVVTIHINAVLGDVRLLLPPGVPVESQFTTILGTNKVKSSNPMPGAPLVKLTGRSILGDLKVTTKDLDEDPSFWWRWL